MSSATIDDYRWLTSTAGKAALDKLGHESKGDGQVDVRVAARLRKSYSAARSHLLLEQMELRRRAREKFADSEVLFFTRKGLEQATDDCLATNKAGRFPTDKLIADLCSGIGGDALSLAARGPLIGYEADEVTAHLADGNLRARGCEAGLIRHELAVASSVQNAAAWHIDPDRRATGKRVIELADYEPGPEFLRSLLAANPNGAVKVAPAAELNSADWPPLEREWLGSRGECRQQVLWLGNLANRPGHHTATEVGLNRECQSFSGPPNLPFDYAAAMEAHLYEPSATVLAAQLAGAFAAEHKLTAVTQGGGYLTADHFVQHPLITAFRVRDVLPFDQRKLRAYCREHGLGQLEIKKRGVDIEPSRVRREIITDGSEPAVIFITPVAGSVKAIVASRIE